MAISIVVVGPGLIGRRHMALIRANPDTRLSAVVAPDRAPNHATAADAGVQLYSDLDACSASERIDAVVLSSPNAFHFEQARWCIERRIPVLIEKPVAPTVHEARELVRLTAHHQTRALVGHHRAHSPLLTTAHELIASGRLGRLVSVVGSAQFYKPAQYFLDGPWRTQPGGGPILINLIHEIGILRTLMGEITSVQAIASSAVRKFAVEDTVAINFGFANGALGTFVLSDTAATPMSWEQTTQENPDYPSYGDVDCYTVSGTQGSLGFPTMRIRNAPAGVEASWWKPYLNEQLTVHREDPLRCQLAHFVQVIRGNVEPKVSVADGWRNMAVVEAVRRATVSGQTVTVEF